MQLKAGYYIQEFNDLLAAIVGEDVFLAFHKTTNGIAVEGLPELPNYSSVNPLLKVAWNIVTRGEKTLGSIFLSQEILTRHLKKESIKRESLHGIERLNIASDEFKNLDKDELVYLLTNFNEIEEGEVASKLGSSYLLVFRILRDLQLAAQYQVVVLLLVLLNKLNVNEDEPVLLLDDLELGKLAVQDLNHLFHHLNALISNTEEPLKLIACGNENTKKGLSVGYSQQAEIKLSAAIKKDVSFYSQVLTDRHISYKQLGDVVEYEVIDDKGEAKYAQRFDFHSLEQEEAITYFLQNIFRKQEFRPGQLGIINRAIQNQDVIGLLPTGGGKSLTYQICAILQPGVTVVIDPINSLMKDQFDKLVEYGFTKTQYINSFNKTEERDENLENLTLGKYLIVFVSPERFQIEKFRTSLEGCSANGVYFSYAVIDEAHCVSEWGHDFRHTYLNLAENIKRFCTGKSKALSLFGLTATASFDVLADVTRELDMPQNAIISLPPKAIDREELNFEIIPTKVEISQSIPFYERERALSVFKYPLIKSFILQFPEKVAKLKKPPDLTHNFFEKSGGKYKNAGIIFCPTKSDRLESGVVMIRDSIETWYPSGSEAIGTFFGSADEDSIVSDKVSKLAEESRKNQDDFINDRTNLMVSTKAFGMGIDKGNIRYTLHYTLPNSVESFYQEAGRAGRDRVSSICGILYNDVDRRGNLDFLENSFKGVDREKNIMNELLDEVQYEDNFNLNVLKRKVQDRFPKLKSMRLDQQANTDRDRYIWLNGTFQEVTIGKIDLERNLISYDNVRKNIDSEEAEEIITYTCGLLRQLCPNGNYVGWIKQQSAPGIKTLIDEEGTRLHTLRIGFTNRVMTEMKTLVDESGVEEFDEKIVRAAYNFSTDEEHFIEKLHFHYGFFHNWQRELSLSEEVKSKLKEQYPRIRNTADTLRAIYRMTIVGIIDDYTIDYAGRFLEVKFQRKEETDYIANLREYFKRYLGDKETNKQLSKVKQSNESSILNRTLFTLLEFINHEIGKKRTKSIEYMAELCELGLAHGDQVFRENIVYYFTSKYARKGYLPKDTDNGRVATTAIVKTYLDYISKPPDGLGGEIDNAKHLRGACSMLRIGMKEENASVDLLTSFSSFALDSNVGSESESSKRVLRQEAKELYAKGFKTFSKSEPWDNVRSLLQQFNSKVIDLNPSVQPEIELLTNKVLVYRTSNKLSKFLKSQLRK